MRVVNWKSELPEDAQPMERVKVGKGKVWSVYKYNKYNNAWVLQYWSH